MATLTEAFPWKSTYVLEINEVDEQHKRLVRMLNDLQIAMQDGRGQDALQQTLMELIQYCKVHFSAEERLMRFSQYPALETHISQHHGFTSQVAQFYQDYAARRVVLSVKMLRFLKDWLVNHIQNEDRRFAKHYHQRNGR